MFAYGVPNIWELLIVAVVVLLLFGTRLPSMMGSVGRSINEFKKGMKSGDSGDDGAPSSP